jgi:hypothetical protein
MESADASTSDHLKMIGAVHGALPSNLSAAGIAASLLALLAKREIYVSQIDGGQIANKLRALIRAVAGELGSSFDGCQLLQSMLSFDISSDSWTARNEEDRARLMFQCVTLLAAVPASSDRTQHKQNARKAVTSSVLNEELATLRKKLTRARKLLLSWCCADYAPLCYKEDLQHQVNDRTNKKVEEIVGAGTPDYNSVLDGLNNSKVPPWLGVMRSVLFMEDAESPVLHRFLSPDGSLVQNESGWLEESKRIHQCCEQGADLDDEMIWIVLKSAAATDGSMSCQVALPLLEHLFDCCNKDRGSSLRLKDPTLIWALYNLVEYTPPERPTQGKGDQFVDEEIDYASSENGQQKPAKQQNGKIEGSTAKEKQEIPR